MNIKDFMYQIESYYGAYDEQHIRIKLMVEAFLKDFKPDKFPALLKLVMMNHPVKYGSPDISAIEKAYDYALKNGKCEDMKVKYATNYKIEDEPTEEELAETRKLIESGEGKSLTEMFSEKMHKMQKDLKG